MEIPPPTKQVLFVDDNRIAQALMRKHLLGLCEVTVLSTLAAAFEALKERRFDLVITDFLFPEGDSLALIAHIRQSEAAEKLPLIVVSASVDRVLLSRVLRAGANEALPKPIVAEEFRSLVVRMLQDPYVRESKETVYVVTCFEWRAGGLHYQYSPELHQAVSGPTRADASRVMQELLDEQCAQGARLGAITHEGVLTHVVFGGTGPAGEIPSLSS